MASLLLNDLEMGHGVHFVIDSATEGTAIPGQAFLMISSR